MRNLTGDTVPSSQEAHKDLSRQVDHGVVHVVAMLYSQPYLRAIQAAEGEKAQTLKSLVEQSTVFKIDLAGPDAKSIIFDFWQRSFRPSFLKAGLGLSTARSKSEPPVCRPRARHESEACLEYSDAPGFEDRKNSKGGRGVRLTAFALSGPIQ